MAETGGGVDVLFLGGEGPDRDPLVAALEADGHSVDATSGGVDGTIDRLDEFDGVVVRHDPPAIDGIALLETVEESGIDRPAVLLDAEASAEVASRAIALDVADYLPVDGTTEFGDVADRAARAIVDSRERREYVETLERDRDILDALFEDVPIHLYVKDEEGRHLRVSAQQGDPGDFVGKTDLEVWGEEARDAYEDDMRVIEEGEPIVNKEEPNSDWNQYFLTTKIPWRDEEGEVQGLIGLTREVTERKRQERQLRRQNERLRTVSSVIAHDVRTPLNLALGKMDLVARECDSEHVEDVEYALDRTNELLRDLLSLVRHGQWVEETEPVALERVAVPAWRSVDAPDASLEIDQPFVLQADRDRLRELLENLFRNAIEHAGSDVAVRIGNLPDWSGFYVEDDGPGIPEDERETVLESGYTTAEEGTGFGLSIVEVIAEAHGWDVSVTEGSEGGARFEFVGVRFE